MDRRTFVAGTLGLLASPLAAEGQPASRVPRIGVLISGSASSTSALTGAFRQGLRDLGYVPGQSIIIEYRYGEGQRDRFPGLATELVRLKVDIIVGGGGSQIRAAKQATGTIPIVMANVSDPVARGFVASLARPQGNITGLSALAPELGKKRLELLKEIVPSVSRVAVLGVREIQGFDPELKELEVAAAALRLQLLPVPVRGPQDLENAFSTMARAHVGALIGLLDPAIEFLRGQIAALAVTHRLPAVAFEREHVELGWLMSYGPDYRALWRRAATYVDKILKGARPADLPVEQPTKVELVISARTAKALGLTIPPSVLALADEIIQ